MHFKFQMLISSLLGILTLATQPFPSWQDAVLVTNETVAADLMLAQVHHPPPIVDHLCYPPGRDGAAQFIIGYGSLMQRASKIRTHPHTGERIPIRAYGFERSWSCRGQTVSLSTTYLGVDMHKEKNSYLNGVFLKIPSAAALEGFDRRETFYCREEVPMSKMQLLSNETKVNTTIPQGQYWIYVTKKEYREFPTAKYPIVQSYVDTFLSGCLELEKQWNMEGFSEECIKSTVGWNSPWVNDRIYPRRPFMHQPLARDIDALLYKTVPEAYNNITIEG